MSRAVSVGTLRADTQILTRTRPGGPRVPTPHRVHVLLVRTPLPTPMLLPAELPAPHQARSQYQHQGYITVGNSYGSLTVHVHCIHAYIYSFFTAGLTRKPLYTQAQPAPYSSGHSAATTAFPQTHTSPHVCEAKGCYKTAYYDPMLGYFSYCSPKCRDECLLPDYNTKLKADIANFEANPPTEYTQSLLSYGEIVRQPEIKKDSREPLGIIFARTDAKKVSTHHAH